MTRYSDMCNKKLAEKKSTKENVCVYKVLNKGGWLDK